MVERVLSMHEAQGSIPWSSTFVDVSKSELAQRFSALGS